VKRALVFTLLLLTNSSVLPALPALPASPAQPAQSSPPKRKLFEPNDLGLLDAPDRDQWQKPEQIMDTLGIADGSVVADLGAGGAWFTLHIARRVGPNGIVYAEDIQPAMLQVIRQRMQVENLLNVRAILGTPSDPRLPKGLDAAIIVDSYHEMDDPSNPNLVITLLRNIVRSLRGISSANSAAVFNKFGVTAMPAAANLESSILRTSSCVWERISGPWDCEARTACWA